MRRLGIRDIPKLGFPTLDEIGIIVVHESYQFLSKTYVENDKTFIDIEELDSSFLPQVMDNSPASTFKRRIQSQVEIEANQDYELFSKYCATSDDNTLNVTNAEIPHLQRRNSCKAKIQNYDESIESAKGGKMSRSNSLGNSFHNFLYTHQDNSLNATKETESKHISHKMLSVANGLFLSAENWAPNSQGVDLTFIVKRIF